MHVETFLKEKTLVHGVLASPLTNAEQHNLKHPEDGFETSCTRVYVTLWVIFGSAAHLYA